MGLWAAKQSALFDCMHSYATLKFVYDQCDQIKIAKCLQKLPKNQFTRKMKDFDTFTEIA